VIERCHDADVGQRELRAGEVGIFDQHPFEQREAFHDTPLRFVDLGDWVVSCISRSQVRRRSGSGILASAACFSSSGVSRKRGAASAFEAIIASAGQTELSITRMIQRIRHAAQDRPDAAAVRRKRRRCIPSSASIRSAPPVVEQRRHGAAGVDREERGLVMLALAHVDVAVDERHLLLVQAQQRLARVGVGLPRVDLDHCRPSPCAKP
jgi:hypothetical protein